MKTNILTLFLIIVQSTFSQNIEELFYGPNVDWCGVVQVSEYQYIFSNTKDVSGLITKDNSSLISYNIVNKQAKKYFFNDSILVDFIVNDDFNQNVLVVGTQYKNFQKYIHIYRFDYDLNLINESQFLFNHQLLTSCMLSLNNNILLLGLKYPISDHESFLIECNEIDGLINYKNLRFYY